MVPPDPYSNLPPDSRQVVDSVASMGFPKAQAARAVEKLGADQKEVILKKIVLLLFIFSKNVSARLK